MSDDENESPPEADSTPSPPAEAEAASPPPPEAEAALPPPPEAEAALPPPPEAEVGLIPPPPEIPQSEEQVAGTEQAPSQPEAGATEVPPPSAEPEAGKEEPKELQPQTEPVAAPKKISFEDNNDDDLNATPSSVIRRPRRKKKSTDSTGEDEGDDDKEEGDEDEVEKASKAQEAKKKTKRSLSVHLQAELNKQRLIAAKQAREDRRSQLEMQHHYLIEQVAAHIDLKPKEVEEFIIDSASYMGFLNSFIEKKGTKSIVFVYQKSDPPGPDSGRPMQGKKEKMMRVLVSGGLDIGLKGKVMYYVRPQNDTKVSIKTIADETFFGLLNISDPEEPGIVIDALVYHLNTLLIPYLQANPSWVSITDPELAETIRHKFLTSIGHYSEFLSDCKNDISSRLDLTKIVDMTRLIDNELFTPEKVLEAAKKPDIVAKVEHMVILWCKNIERVLALSKQMRKDTDAMGPNAELAYWRNFHAKMSFIIQQIQQWQFVHVIQVLVHTNSKVLRRWKDVDARVTDDYHESKDNVRYMYALSKFVEPLYQQDPYGMVQYIPSLMYTIQTIHTTSRYYNSCEKVTALLVKISNQIVFACRRFLTKDGTQTIWNQDKRTMIEKLTKCLELYAIYRGSYESTKAELQDVPEGKQFNFSVNNIFGRYDQFCERLRKIITLLEIFDMYKFVHESHIDGIDAISVRITALFEDILKKTNYDALEFRQSDFDKDFVIVRSALDEIQKDLETFMDRAIDNCSTAMHCLELLDRFANLRNRCLNIEEKQWYAFQFYHNEINMLKGIYESEKNDTPIPRGFPPFAGKIAWARHLFKRLERPMLYFQENTNILERDDARPTFQAYNGLAKKLIYFEILFHDAWVKQTAAIYDSLEAPLLTLRGTIRQEMVLNFDPFFRQIIDETEIIRKMELEIPDVAQIVYYRQDKIFGTYEKMKNLLEKFLNVKSKIQNDLMVLIRALFKRVEKSFMPGVTNINWTSFKCDEYFEYIEVHLDELETIAEKVDDILTVRVNQCLYDISHTLMIDLPEEKPMMAQDYMERIHKYGQIVAKDLEYKSRHCEAAVIELINTLVATNELNVPDQVLYSWMNPNLFGKLEKKDSEVKSAMKEKNIPAKATRSDNNVMLTIMVNELSQTAREEVMHLHEECRHVFMFYSHKCIEALQKTTRISLDMLRRRTEEAQPDKRNPGKVDNRVPLFTSDLIVTIPTISLKPPIEESQKVLSRSVGIVVECLKNVVIWGQSRRYSFDATNEESYFKDSLNDAPSVEVKPYERLQSQDAYVKASFQVANINSKLKNCYKSVMDYKDISKMVVIMQSVVTQAKPKINSMIQKYMAYSYLWRQDREDEIKVLINESPAITEVRAVVQKYNELIDEINKITSVHRIGPLEIYTSEMKLGLIVEVKTWKNILCKHLAEHYRKITIEITKFIEDMNKELTIEIKVLEHIKLALDALAKIRDRFVDIEALLTPIEECYAFLYSQRYKVPSDDRDRAESLRSNFNLLQEKTIVIQTKISYVEDENRRKLLEAITQFQIDLKQYLIKYVERGPMVDGLSPQDASDRLLLFQDMFDSLWDRYTLYNQGERIFGFIPKEYPELMKHKKELILLQKLYSLFNDTTRSIEAYSEIKWTNLDIEKIKTELTEFQHRCNNLPKALKEWPAYVILKKKIDDFSETCPLLEHMADSVIKERHWERIGEITSYKFNIENENFCLKHVLGAPLLKFKHEVEDIWVGAGQEKFIETNLRQIQLDWSTNVLQFASFKARGEIILKDEETLDILAQLEDALKILNSLNENRHSALFKKELTARLTDFNNTSNILQMWLTVQNLWMSLEDVFVGDLTVARHIPQEAKRFQNVDRAWAKLMTRSRENPLVIPCCVGEETTGQTIRHFHDQLELAQKAVTEFMETRENEEGEAATG